MAENNLKHFDEWNSVKTELHFAAVPRTVREGEVWWCSVGENVGVEINGKQDLFLRPVLVLKKLSRFGFMGVPLTSQPHEGSWYVPFMFKDKEQNAVLVQARVLSVYRLRRKMGEVPNTDLELIKDGFRRLYL